MIATADAMAPRNDGMMAALELAEEHSIPVFPCDADKKPLTRNGFKDASQNLLQIEDWWTRSPDALVAVPTGAQSGLLVIDIDPVGAGWYADNAAALACGRVHKTRRGHHLLYRMPTVEVRNSASKLAAGVDVRAEGGYVIWWPANGMEATGDMEDITDPPAWVLQELRNGGDGRSRSGNGLDRHEEPHAVFAGRRNDFLSREAFRLRKQGSSHEQILEVVTSMNAARCVPPVTEAELRKLVAGKATIEPDAVALTDFHAYMPMHSYIFVPTRELWPASSVNARIPPVPISDEKTIKASEWVDQHQPVEQMTWAPGLPMVVADKVMADGGWINRHGCNVFNLYRPPLVQAGDASKAGPWIDHLHRVYPTDADHIAKWLAHRVQHPDQKCNHAVVFGGAQGIGKDTILEAVKYAVGPWNFVEVSPAQMLGRFNGFLKSVILRVSEARDLGDVDRYGFYDHLKAYTAAPPDVLRCDEKHLREHAVLNVCGVIITSNHKTDGIYLPADDRRHYVAWSELTRDVFAADYWSALYRWYANGGNGHVAAYLAGLDLSMFDPKAPPPKTAAFWDIVSANRAPEDAELADVIDALNNPAALTVSNLVTYASDAFREWLQDRRNSRQIPHRLEAVGYVAVRNDADRRDGHWKVWGKRQVIYGKKDLSVRDRIIAAASMCRENSK